VFIPCDEVLLAVGQLNAFPWIEPDAGIKFDLKRAAGARSPITLQSTLPRVFFGGDAAFGPRNIITAVAHGHEAAISIHLFCQGEDPEETAPPRVNLAGQQMGVHDWLYQSQVMDDRAPGVPMLAKAKTLKDRLLEVELGFDREGAYRGQALPQLRRPDRLHRARPASNATPVSTPARKAASTL
jgi:formate dehydrogenase (NADP+) beta subunit